MWPGRNSGDKRCPWEKRTGEFREIVGCALRKVIERYAEFFSLSLLFGRAEHDTTPAMNGICKNKCLPIGTLIKT